MTPFNVVSPDIEFFGPRADRANLRFAASLPDLRDALENGFEPASGPATLDLTGHSTRGHHLLRLGGTPIDMLDRRVHRFFTDLATAALLPRLGIATVRLLGCETALTDAGRRTLRMLAWTLRVPVFGTRKDLLKWHFTHAGLDPAFDHLLVEVATLSRPSS
jgi:hypothetical protein